MRRSSGRALGFTRGRKRTEAWEFKSLPSIATGKNPCKSPIFVPHQRMLHRLVLLLSATSNTRVPDVQLRVPANAFIKGSGSFTRATVQRSTDRLEIGLPPQPYPSCGSPSLSPNSHTKQITH